jgi:hypothetical protein
MRTGRDAVEDDAMTWWTGTNDPPFARFIRVRDGQTNPHCASVDDRSIVLRNGIYERDEYAVQHRLGRRQAIWLICLLRLPVLLHTSGLSQPRLPGMTTRLCAPEFS